MSKRKPNPAAVSTALANTVAAAALAAAIAEQKGLVARLEDEERIRAAMRDLTARAAVLGAFREFIGKNYTKFKRDREASRLSMRDLQEGYYKAEIEADFDTRRARADKRTNAFINEALNFADLDGIVASMEPFAPALLDGEEFDTSSPRFREWWECFLATDKGAWPLIESLTA